MAGRPLGSISLKGKQSEEERKLNKRKYKRTEVAAERAVQGKKIKRMEAKQIRLDEALNKRKKIWLPCVVDPFPRIEMKKDYSSYFEVP